MAVDNSGSEIVTPEQRAVYDEHDKVVDQYLDYLIHMLQRPPTPKPHTLPMGTDRMRYAAIERGLMTATHGLLREYQRWKETRS